MADAETLVDIEVTTTVDLTDQIHRRLIDSERAVFQRHRADMETYVQERWVGWRYEGRPPGAPRNVSRRAWRSRIETTEASAVLVLANQARSWDSKEPYAAFVRRFKGFPPEWRVVLESILREYWPKMVTELREEVRRNLSTPGKPKRLRGKRIAIAQRGTLE